MGNDMLNEFAKSIRSILYERISSPLSGALFFSWLLWNWRIPYYLFVTDSTLTIDSRLNYIKTNLSSPIFCIILPIVTAIFIVLIYPILTTYTLKIWLKYKKWQYDIKNEIEQKRLISLEDSIQLRLEIKQQAEEFDKLLKDKNKELENLNSKINSLENSIVDKDNKIKQIQGITSPIQKDSNDLLNTEKNFDKDYSNFISDQSMLNHFIDIASSMYEDNQLLQGVSGEVIAYYISHDVIKKDSKYLYSFTTKGRLFYRRYTQEKNIKQQ